jgi:hypothetical protein
VTHDGHARDDASREAERVAARFAARAGDAGEVRSATARGSTACRPSTRPESASAAPNRASSSALENSEPEGHVDASSGKGRSTTVESPRLVWSTANGWVIASVGSNADARIPSGSSTTARTAAVYSAFEIAATTCPASQ